MQIDATEGEANGMFMGYATYAAVLNAFINLKMAEIPEGADPALFGIREENFTSKRFVENYYSRRTPFTGGLWNAMLSRFSVDHIETNIASITKDKFDEMVFYFNDAQGFTNSVGITAKLIPLRTAAVSYSSGARWAVDLTYHTLWLNIGGALREISIKVGRHVVADENMRILQHGY